MHGWTPVGCAWEEEERKRSGRMLWKQLGDVDGTIAFTTGVNNIPLNDVLQITNN